MTQHPHAAAASPSPADECPFPDFVPVPVKPRHDGWTPERQRLFIQWLAVSGSIDHAAQSVSMSRRSAYRLRDHAGAESFRLAWNNALEIGQDRLVHSAYDRAIQGIITPVFYRGKLIGERRRYNERLLIEALKARGMAQTMMLERDTVACSKVTKGHSSHSVRQGLP